MLYDTLIIGSGYASLGYALTGGNTLICEASELCDTEFCMPVRGFGRVADPCEYPLGKELLDYYERLGIIRDGVPNTTALECGFCGFAIEHGADIRLKCRVVDTVRADDGVITARLISGGGIEHVYARRVIDMRTPAGSRYLTFLFTADSKNDVDAIASAFPEAEIEPAFYDGRYAMYLPIGDEDYVTAKAAVYERWRDSDGRAKLLYTAPVVCVRSEGGREVPADADHTDIISAFEAGIRYAESTEV